MDSVTQFALGAAVGEATLGRQVGRKAAVWGGICGTLPDLDVLVPFGDAVADFTYHRSASHSLFLLAVLTPIVVWLITRLHPQTAVHRKRWHLLVYLAFATHVLLDSFTAYGTQIFWPFEPPIAWSTLFIIDPLYTLPLIIGGGAALAIKRDRTRAHQLNWAGLILSTLYLSWSVLAKVQVGNVVTQSLTARKLPYERIFTTPAPFNTLLWRAVVMNQQGYYEGYYSLLDGGSQVDFSHYPSEETLLDSIQTHWPVQRLTWFSKGFYSVTREQDAIVISDLRMGLEPNYVFRFKVAELNHGHVVATSPKQLATTLDYSTLEWVWRRIWDENAKGVTGDSRQ